MYGTCGMRVKARRERAMGRDVDQEASNKALVLEAFDALFNRRDFAAAQRYFSPTYIQHSVGIARRAASPCSARRFHDERERWGVVC
jgi:hypothetical protein